MNVRIVVSWLVAAVNGSAIGLVIFETDLHSATNFALLLGLLALMIMNIVSISRK